MDDNDKKMKQKLASQRYREKNKEKLNAYVKQWKDENREQLNAYRRAYYAQKKAKQVQLSDNTKQDKVRKQKKPKQDPKEYMKSYYQKNKEKIKQKLLTKRHCAVCDVEVTHFARHERTQTHQINETLLFAESSSLYE